MTDPLTTEIRRAVAELVDAAPLPPDFDEIVIHPLGRDGRRGVGIKAAAGIVVVAVAAVVLFAVRRSPGPTTVTILPSSSTTLTMSAGTPIVGAIPPTPTLVSPTKPPPGLRFIVGGSSDGAAQISNEILVAGPPSRSARLIWFPPYHGACIDQAPATTVAPGTSGTNSALAPTVLPVSPQQAAFTPSGDGGSSLEWCVNKTFKVDLDTTGFDETTARALAATVELVRGQSDEFTLVAPPGFVAGRPSTGGTMYVLTFGRDAASTSTPPLTVMIQGAWTTNLNLLESQSPPATNLDIGGRPAFIFQLPGGPRYQWLTIVYDNRTVVTLEGDGLTRQQLISAGSSLAPADPSLAANVSGDPQLCEHLGLCG
jgi:hypothetical protein